MSAAATISPPPPTEADDDDDEYTYEVERIDDTRFFRDKAARGRPNFAAMHKLEDQVLFLLRRVFPPKVSERYGGIVWGKDQLYVAHVYHSDNRMYFNARAHPSRSLFDVFMDVCHEWTHARYEYSHNEDFTSHLEVVIATYMPAFFQSLHS